jgi:hypothetical protein
VLLPLVQCWQGSDVEIAANLGVPIVKFIDVVRDIVAAADDTVRFAGATDAVVDGAAHAVSPEINIAFQGLGEGRAKAQGDNAYGQNRYFTEAAVHNLTAYISLPWKDKQKAS